MGRRAVARLRRGAAALWPRVEVLGSEFLDGRQRERIRLRLQLYVQDRIQADLAPLFAAEAGAEEASGLRGPMHRLVENLGLVAGAEDVSQELRAG